jgi:hypothetical protein
MNNLDSNMYESKIEYRNILDIYVIVCGISLLFLSCLVYKSCRNHNNGQNRMRREYLV